VIPYFVEISFHDNNPHLFTVLFRKHNQQAIEDAYKQVSKENKDQLAKYKKRWSTKTGQVLSKYFYDNL
jgi:hypothetical protein